MSDAAKANLAYGYNLGGTDNGGWKLVGADEYGGYEFPWSDGGYSFIDDAEKILGRRADVEVIRSGHHEVPGYVLAIAGEHRSVEWTDTLTLDPFLLERTPADEGWDGMLEAALTALGITPTQDGPRWLVFPSYG